MAIVVAAMLAALMMTMAPENIAPQAGNIPSPGGKLPMMMPAAVAIRGHDRVTSDFRSKEKRRSFLSR
jgi:hypothetical protein